MNMPLPRPELLLPVGATTREQRLVAAGFRLDSIRMVWKKYDPQNNGYWNINEEEVESLTDEIFNAKMEMFEMNVQSKAELLAQQAATLLAEADRLNNLPAEPDSNVVYFRKRFNSSGIYYMYTAVRVSNGTWYVSGRSAVQGSTWQSLIEWISQGSEWEIWEATDFTAIASSDGTFTVED